MADAPGVNSGIITPDAFNQMMTDASSFSITIDSGTRNAIQWISAKRHIVIGTTGGEWRFGGHSNKPFTPTNFDLKQFSNRGSKDMQPVLLSDALAFVNGPGRKLGKVDYDGVAEDYKTPDLTVLAEHVTKTGITTMAFQRNPDEIFWATLDDGNIISMTYDTHQEVIAWARHPMPLVVVNCEDFPTYPTLQVADGTFATAEPDPELVQGTAISDVAGLQNMNLDLTGNYYLTRDIDASSTETWNGGSGFIPIGTHGTNDARDPFTGTFDGNGYTITGLYMNEPVAQAIGLFGAVDHSVIIYNLTLKDLTVIGRSWVGGLIGRSSLHPVTPPTRTTVINCHITGTSTVTGNGFGTAATYKNSVGGFIGLDGEPYYQTQYGAVDFYDCTTNATVSSNGMAWIGGFAGRSRGKFYNCRATGDVSTGTQVGGFIGYSRVSECVDCAATGDVTGTTDVAGFFADGPLVGGYYTRCSARGDVVGTGTAAGFARVGRGLTFTDCYAWGDVTATSIAAGFVGLASVGISTQSFIHCYAIGEIAGHVDYTSGFSGWSDTDSTNIVTACYWDTEASGTEADGTEEIPLAGVVGHTTAWMKTQSNYEGAGWDFDTVWEMPITRICWVPE